MNKEEIEKIVENLSEKDATELRQELDFKMALIDMKKVKEAQKKIEERFEFKVETICKNSTEELDFQFYNEVLGKDRVNQIYDKEDLNEHPSDYITDTRNSNVSDQYPIKIEELERIIEKYKEKGCNYIAIGYHEDHMEYMFEGIKATKIK